MGTTRQRTIGVRVDEAERHAIAWAAKVEQRPLSQWARLVLLKEAAAIEERRAKRR